MGKIQSESPRFICTLHVNHEIIMVVVYTVGMIGLVVMLWDAHLDEFTKTLMNKMF
jgi:hypothetical protein